MRLFKVSLVILFVSILLVSCGGGANGVVGQLHVVISEVMTGITGNNLYDFIEFYNGWNEPIDLNGYNLIYTLSDDGEEITVASWRETTLVPPHGHYLIGMSGQDYGIVVDKEMSQSLIPNRGGLDLRFGVKTIDKVAWGSGPKDLQEKDFASEMAQGTSLERLPGGDLGNGQDSNNNSKDFFENFKSFFCNP